MTLDDLPAVLAIEQVAKPTPWNEKSYRQEITDNDKSYPTALVVNSQLIGYIVWWLIVDEIQIQTIAIDPAKRGQGLGRALLTDALNKGLKQGATISTLEVRESNVVAQSLYQSLGYEVVGKRPNYYRDGETAYLMTAHLK